MRKFALLILKDLFNYELIPGLNDTADEMLKRNKDYSKIEVFEQ